ncbi:MAG: PBSX family phage terminase large subunit, partial [Bartonella sp.]|nr:PBSX family phage terminase large subunit [Bartonella sp.]
PHDGATRDRVHNVSFESALNDAGFETQVIPNQGAGAVKMRIEAVRRILPSVWFNEEMTVAGRKALNWYHEKWDEKRGIG